MSFRIRVYGSSDYPYIWLGLASESPVALTGYIGGPPPHDAQEVIDDPLFISPNRLTARRQKYVLSLGGLVDQVLRSPAWANTEYVRMLTPAGVLWVYGLNDNGSWYIEQMNSNVPTKRILTTTVMHKGTMLFVADNRIKPPTGGL